MLSGHFQGYAKPWFSVHAVTPGWPRSVQSREETREGPGQCRGLRHPEIALCAPINRFPGTRAKRHSCSVSLKAPRRTQGAREGFPESPEDSGNGDAPVRVPEGHLWAPPARRYGASSRTHFEPPNGPKIGCTENPLNTGFLPQGSCALAVCVCRIGAAQA